MVMQARGPEWSKARNSGFYTSRFGSMWAGRPTHIIFYKADKSLFFYFRDHEFSGLANGLELYLVANLN